jgi:hypothetical protein
MAAVLLFERPVAVSHWSAAWLWGFAASGPREVEVTVAARGNRRQGLCVHRVWSLPGPELTERERIPITSPARTLLDVASTSSAMNLKRVVDRARRRGKLDLDEIDAVLARRGASYGAQRLRDALRIYRQPVADRARSELLFLDAVARVGLPAPSINTFVAGCEIDAYWEQERFAVEVDGWEAHGDRAAFENDRLRQEDLKLAGIDSVRIAAARLEREPQAVAVRLRRLLERRRAEVNR